MQSYTWFKHSISFIALAFLLTGIFTINGIDIREEQFVNALLQGSYHLCIALVLIAFRISLIGSSNIKWTAFGLTIVLLTLLSIMHFSISTVPSLWDFTLTFFALLVTESIISQMPHKNRFTYIIKALVLLSLGCLVIGLAFKISSAVYYAALYWLLTLTSMGILVHFFLPKKTIQ